jgi:hypothetical protein
MTKKRFFKGEEIHIHLLPEVTGVRRCATSKRIPLHWKREADELVACMIKADVIERVTKPTQWCSTGKFILKPNRTGIRMVHDFVNLNRNVKRPSEPGNSALDIHKQILSDSTYFVAMDLSVDTTR